MTGVLQGVIFDVVGTLVDRVDLHIGAWARIFAKWGHLAPFDAVQGQMGKGGDELMPEFLPRDLVERESEGRPGWMMAVVPTMPSGD